jgi:hypothetical protein
LSGLDELLSGIIKMEYSNNVLLLLCTTGMLSKSKGQILRVAAVLHVLFHIQDCDQIPLAISEGALKAAEDFVSVCLQHGAYMAGRGLFEDAIKQAEASEYTCSRSTEDT